MINRASLAIRVVGGGAAALVACGASAAWGLKFEVWNGSAWTQSISLAGGTPAVVPFRFGVYFDPASPPQITTAAGTGTAQSLMRFQGSNEATVLGIGDQLQNMHITIANWNATLIKITGGTIGTDGAASFGAQLFSGPIAFESYKQVYTGEVSIGNDPAQRAITLRSKSFGFNTTPGVRFYNSVQPGGPTPGQGDAPVGGVGRVDLNAVINVSGDSICPPDLNHDTVVDDSDFPTFAMQYDIAICADPGMLPGCPADFNHDGMVDDSDFVYFAVCYDRLACPQ